MYRVSNNHQKHEQFGVYHRVLKVQESVHYGQE